MRKIVNVRTSFYQAEKPGGIAAFAQALSAGVSASKTTRQDSLAAISQEVEPPNSNLAIPLQAQIGESVAIAFNSQPII